MTRTEQIRQLILDNPRMSNGDLTYHVRNTMVTRFRRVPMSELHEWANIKRLAKRFYSEEGEITHKQLYDELMQLLQGKQDSVNVNSKAEGVTGLITDLVTNGLLTMEEIGELQALGTEEVTLATSLGLGGLTWQEVRDVREVM